MATMLNNQMVYSNSSGFIPPIFDDPIFDDLYLPPIYSEFGNDNTCIIVI